MNHDEKCGGCGSEIHGLVRDYAFTFPDEIANMPRAQRRRVEAMDDFCAIDIDDDEKRRVFVRCVLPVRFLDEDEGFRFGVWVEFNGTKEEMKEVVRNWKENKPVKFEGFLANDLPGMKTLGLVVEVQSKDPTQRPRVCAAAGAVGGLFQRGWTLADYEACKKAAGI